MADRSSDPQWLANEDGGDRPRFDEPDAETDGAEGSPGRGMSLRERMERDDQVLFSVKHLRMTIPQILEFSECWKHPFYDEKAVWRRVNSLKLRNRVKRVAEQSIHDHCTFKLCLKIWRDAHRNEFPITGIEKESRLPDAGIRADMRFNLGKRLFFHEHQRSVLTYMGWKTKLTKYVRYRRRDDVGPFRVLITMDDESNLNTVYRYAREVTADHPELCLFLLGWQPDILGQYDTTTEPVWVTNRLIDGRPETVSLMG